MASDHGSIASKRWIGQSLPNGDSVPYLGWLGVGSCLRSLCYASSIMLVTGRPILTRVEFRSGRQAPCTDLTPSLATLEGEASCTVVRACIHLPITDKIHREDDQRDSVSVDFVHCHFLSCSKAV